MSFNAPILVLDSGLGGLTVARAIHERLPNEQIVYFGDTARLPYGSKSPQTVTHFVRQIIRWSMPLLPKHVVIACNTASALALPHLRDAVAGLTLSGVIDPGARAAVRAAGNRSCPLIGVIATEATIRSKAYERAIKRRRMAARMLLRATPLLVPIIEEGRELTDPLVDLALRQYLKPMLKRGIDVLVLGCTHYPLLRDRIVDVVGADVAVIDSAEQCAEDVARKIAPNVPGSTTTSGGWIRTYVTDDPDRFGRLAERFLGESIDLPTLVSPDDLYATDALAVVAGG